MYLPTESSGTLTNQPKIQAMKKILISSIAFLGLGVLSTGCLKDKGFENNEYGYQQVEDTRAVAMAQANTARNISIKAVDPDQGPYSFYITYEGPTLAPADITGTIVVDNSILSQFPGIDQELPAGTYRVDPTFTIKAGERADTVNVYIQNASALDASVVYGLGVKLNTVDGGYAIPANLRSLAFSLGVKNKYDGVYDLAILTRGWAAYGISENVSNIYPADDDGKSIGMESRGPNAVALINYWAETNLQPGFTDAQSPTQFGAAEPLFTFNPVTDALVDVTNLAPDDGRGRAFAMNPAVTTSRFDPATRTIYAAYLLKQNGRPDLQIFDTLTFHSERP
ncbi:MAG: DUF1735 domain-containing protein [Chitinophagaceae bacterium]|nr:MAG: DUF1735 domain-containing protein [Chitinophagaceae bacterium]